MEHGKSKDKNALEEISEKYKIKTCSIVSMDEVTQSLKENTDIIDENINES
ncbi:hypothetical protein ABGF48_03105 [Helcococcus bovis]|uniref:hypothetical protein n=1 Tax=Helcococcus bovis TaxID=3153252 RepID=UPI0038BC676A